MRYAAKVYENINDIDSIGLIEERELCSEAPHVAFSNFLKEIDKKKSHDKVLAVQFCIKTEDVDIPLITVNPDDEYAGQWQVDFWSELANR